MKDDPIRTQDHSDLMWGMLTDLSKQLQWPVNGSLVYMDKDDWKNVMTAGLRRHHRIAAGIDGGAVVLGMRTSKMRKSEMNDLIALMEAFGANRDPQIVWTHETKRLTELVALKAGSPYAA